MSITAHPLQWPDGWPRAKDRKQANFGRSEFKTGKSYKSRIDITMNDAMKRVRLEIERLGADVVDDMIVSTNLKLNPSGVPRG